MAAFATFFVLFLPSLVAASGSGDRVVGQPAIYQPSIPEANIGGVDPFLAFGDHYHVLPGVTVKLRLINIHSQGMLPPVTLDDIAVRHVISHRGVVVSDVQADIILGTMGVGSSSYWSADAMRGGAYVFDAYATIPSTGKTYHAASLPFTVVGKPFLDEYIDPAAATPPSAPEVPAAPRMP